uniref:Uncharacterized protein n=1 Tax=Timema cristinae TaxID=61476 RepID=A0A7R9H713_TIMCR|nr:unnamed protein product [Timema cristinae]
MFEVLAAEIKAGLQADVDVAVNPRHHVWFTINHVAGMNIVRENNEFDIPPEEEVHGVQIRRLWFPYNSLSTAIPSVREGVTQSLTDGCSIVGG